MTTTQLLPDAQAELVETAQMRIANQRIKLQQQQQARKAAGQQKRDARLCTGGSCRIK